MSSTPTQPAVEIERTTTEARILIRRVMGFSSFGDLVSVHP